MASHVIRFWQAQRGRNLSLLRCSATVTLVSRRESRLYGDSAAFRESENPARRTESMVNTRSSPATTTTPGTRPMSTRAKTHGEASFVHSCGMRSVLDAGCGTGRRVELIGALDVVGVDLDAEMLATAQRKAPRWRACGPGDVDLGRIVRSGSRRQRHDLPDAWHGAPVIANLPALARAVCSSPGFN
jgi:SAM-dependent methyltransferase